MVSPVRGDGRPGPQCARVDGAAFMRARRRKETTYPKFSGANGRARLVVLVCEVGGLWSVRYSFIQIGMSLALFIPKIFIPKPLSYQNHFHPKQLSSHDHFHPMTTLIQNHFHPIPTTTNNRTTTTTNNQQPTTNNQQPTTEQPNNNQQQTNRPTEDQQTNRPTDQRSSRTVM